MKEITYTDYVVPFLNQLPQRSFSDGKIRG